MKIYTVNYGETKNQVTMKRKFNEDTLENLKKLLQKIDIKISSISKDKNMWTAVIESMTDGDRKWGPISKIRGKSFDELHYNITTTAQAYNLSRYISNIKKDEEIEEIKRMNEFHVNVLTEKFKTEKDNYEETINKLKKELDIQRAATEGSKNKMRKM